MFLCHGSLPQSHTPCSFLAPVLGSPVGSQPLRSQQGLLLVPSAVGFVCASYRGCSKVYPWVWWCLGLILSSPRSPFSCPSAVYLEVPVCTSDCNATFTLYWTLCPFTCLYLVIVPAPCCLGCSSRLRASRLSQHSGT